MNLEPSPKTDSTDRPPSSDTSPTRWIAPALLATTAAWTLATFVTLPDPCPIHFDLQGRVTRTGPRATLLLLPIIPIALVVGITVIERVVTGFRDPGNDLVNVIGPRTERNLRRQLALLPRFLRPLKVLIALIFLVAAVETTLVGWGVRTTLSPTVLVLVGLLLGWTLVGPALLIARARRIASEEAERGPSGPSDARGEAD